MSAMGRLWLLSSLLCAGLAFGRDAIHIRDAVFSMNETAETATPMAPSTTATALTSAAVDALGSSACGGRTIHALGAQLYFCDGIVEITAPTALDGAVCTAEADPTSLAPVAAAATITATVENAPTPVATSAKTIAYPAQSLTTAYTNTYWQDIPAPTDKSIAIPVPGLGFAMYAPLPIRQSATRLTHIDNTRHRTYTSPRSRSTTRRATPSPAAASRLRPRRRFRPRSPCRTRRRRPRGACTTAATLRAHSTAAAPRAFLLH